MPSINHSKWIVTSCLGTNKFPSNRIWAHYCSKQMVSSCLQAFTRWDHQLFLVIDFYSVGLHLLEWNFFRVQTRWDHKILLGAPLRGASQTFRESEPQIYRISFWNVTQKFFLALFYLIFIFYFGNCCFFTIILFLVSPFIFVTCCLPIQQIETIHLHYTMQFFLYWLLSLSCIIFVG